MRRDNIAEGFYYHIVNRGNQHQRLYRDRKDWVRFLFLILYYQGDRSFRNIARNVDSFIHKNTFSIRDDREEELVDERQIELVNFCIMPNHFHLTIYNKTSDGVSQYMHRVQNAYGKYFNTKYERKGYVFEGPYRAVHVEDDNQLSYLSTYIHKNPRDLSSWKTSYEEYPWSSLQDYTNKNRWGRLLRSSPILSTFSTPDDYREFVEKSPAKEIDKYLLEPK